MRRLAFSVLAFGLLFVAVGSAHAQLGIYGMASGGFVGKNSQPGQQVNGFAAFGGTFGIYDQFVHVGPVRIGVDGRYLEDSGSNGTSYGNHLHGGLGGARVAFQSGLVPIKPYVQAEFGVAASNYGVQVGSTASFAYQVQGGADFTILPHLDIRVEYGAGEMQGYYNGTSQTLQEAGVGLVVRL